MHLPYPQRRGIHLPMTIKLVAMSMTLPHFADAKTFRAWRSDPPQWLPIALDIARGHCIETRSPHVFSTGTNLVVGLGENLILKIFPPLLRSQFISERGSLMQLRGRLHLPIPEIVAEGERDGWPYLVMTRLAGTLGSEVWPSLPEAQKERVLRQIGKTIAAVQRAPLGPLAQIEPRWSDFMRTQMLGCKARHTRLGLAPKFLAGLDDLLRDAATLILIDAPPVVLIGEYIPENFCSPATTATGRSPACSTSATCGRAGATTICSVRAPSWRRAGRAGCAACSKGLATRSRISR